MAGIYLERRAASGSGSARSRPPQPARNLRALSLTPFQCIHSLFDDIRRRRGNVLDQSLEFLTADGIDLDPKLFGVRQELAVLHCCHEALTQRRKALGWDVRGPQERATIDLFGHEEFQD